MRYWTIIWFAVAILYFTFMLEVDEVMRIYIVIASMVWWYMALNIWANDVANSVWPAVWSKTITLKWAIIIAAIWNISWALIAWWEVVWTIKKWIIDIAWFDGNAQMFILAMSAALLAAAIWLNIATYFKAPISTTHSIVWWVMWAWIAALWVSAVSWPTMWKIVSSWVISPVLWGLIAAFFLFMIKKTIIFQKDKVSAAKKWVPVFVAIMSWAFSTYLILKWLKKLIKIEFIYALLIWLVVAVIVYFLVKFHLSWKKKSILNTRKSINSLFSIPLIFAVALLTFAHWANDVANAIWPLAWIYDAVVSWGVSSKAEIPFWIMLLWGSWISIWLWVFWSRMIKVVWWEITELDQVRAFSIALSAAITVIIASQMWLPVSSTHIALGWIFWVWFLREYLHKKEHSKKEVFVQRGMVFKIVSAWIITVPIIAFMSWMIFLWLTAIWY